jgi:putative membrane protein
MSTIRITAPTLAALLLAASVSACKKDQSAAMDTTGAAPAAATLDTAGTPANPSATTPATGATTPATGATTTTWSNPSVLGFALAANNGEVQLGKLGQTKATNAQVKAFAKQMVTDHSAMLSQTKKLGTKLDATADTTAGDAHDLMAHGNDELKELTDKAAGADWDKNFMDKMIDDHQKVLDKLQDAAKNTTDADVRKALEEATGKVQAHLTKAQDIKTKLQ